MDHVRRGAGCARDEVVALDERNVDALQGEVAERGDAVDAAADDQHLGVGGGRAAGDLGSRVAGAIDGSAAEFVSSVRPLTCGVGEPIRGRRVWMQPIVKRRGTIFQAACTYVQG